MNRKTSMNYITTRLLITAFLLAIVTVLMTTGCKPKPLDDMPPLPPELPCKNGVMSRNLTCYESSLQNDDYINVLYYSDEQKSVIQQCMTKENKNKGYHPERIQKF